jgi:hypothetical protein
VDGRIVAATAEESLARPRVSRDTGAFRVRGLGLLASAGLSLSAIDAVALVSDRAPPKNAR